MIALAVAIKDKPSASHSRIFERNGLYLFGKPPMLDESPRGHKSFRCYWRNVAITSNRGSECSCLTNSHLAPSHKFSMAILV